MEKLSKTTFEAGIIFQVTHPITKKQTHFLYFKETKGLLIFDPLDPDNRNNNNNIVFVESYNDESFTFVVMKNKTDKPKLATMPYDQYSIVK